MRPVEHVVPVQIYYFTLLRTLLLSRWLACLFDGGEQTAELIALYLFIYLFICLFINYFLFYK